ncbi:hypothetical protein N9A72_00550, partial [bacterium]|nr:hypothetical protein [bacterium]
MEKVKERYKKILSPIEEDLRMSMIEAIDNCWMEHLCNADELLSGIGLRAYGGRDPLIEYKKELFNMFEKLMTKINEESITRVFNPYGIKSLEAKSLRDFTEDAIAPPLPFTFPSRAVIKNWLSRHIRGDIEENVAFGNIDEEGHRSFEGLNDLVLSLFEKIRKDDSNIPDDDEAFKKYEEIRN